MKVIFAQGNPGQQYARTRHNVGFLVLDHLAKEWGSEFAPKPKFIADIAETTQNGEKTLLVKPSTFYNETGQSARALIDFYKLNPASDLLVIHDDLALPLGTIRTRLSGGDAGNNGIKSLTSHLGPDFARIKIGIYNPTRDQMDDADFVLGKFSKEENEKLEDLIKVSEKFIIDFIKGNFALTKINT